MSGANRGNSKLATENQQLKQSYWQTQAQYEDQAAAYAKTVETLNRNLSEALEELFRHKLHIQKRLETVHDHVAKTYVQILEEEPAI